MWDEKEERKEKMRVGREEREVIRKRSGKRKIT